MQQVTNIPNYISDEFSLYLENMTSLADPENPDLLKDYLLNLFEQLKEMPLLFNGMVDQLAMAIATKVRIDSKSLDKIDLSQEPEWSDVKPCIGVHADARACITEIMTNAEQELKTAILLIHFYSRYDDTPLKNVDDEYDSYSEYNEYDDYDENY